MSESRILTLDNDLKAEARFHPDVSRLYREPVAEWLAGILAYVVAGGDLPAFDIPLAFPHLPEKDPTGDTAGVLEFAKSAFRDNKHRPPPSGMRAIQAVFNGRNAQTRCNQGLRGTLWARLDPVPEDSEKLKVQLGFSLLDDEPEHSSHVTAFGGIFEGRGTALVFSDLFPSMVRNSPLREIGNAVSRGLPPMARQRLRGIRRDAQRLGESGEVRTLLWSAYEKQRESMGDGKGAMLRGIATDVLEALEKSQRAGLPSRGSKTKVVASETLPEDEAGATAAPDLDGSALWDAVSGLDKVSREVLRLHYKDGLTQAEIAQRLGVSQPRVSQIESAARDALRDKLGNDPS